MGTAAKQNWLLALADPTGPRPKLPARALPAKDLDAVCDLADRHGVLPAFVANIKAAAHRDGAGRIVHPAEALGAALKAAEHRLLQRTALSMALRRQAEELLAAFRLAGVPATVIKGFVVADRLYPSPSLRPFTDVDLLVAPQAVLAAQDQMQRLGYRPCPTRMKRPEESAEAAFRREGLSGAVELHWNLVNSSSLRQAVSVEYGDLQWAAAKPDEPPQLSPASLLLIAAVHGAASHSFDRLQILYDVAQASRGAAGSLDEAWLAEAARRTGAAFALATALHFCDKVLGDDSCHGLLRRLAIRKPLWLASLMITRGVVLRAHARGDSFRRQALREMLKRL